MQRKPVTPRELAERKQLKANYSFSLVKTQVENLRKLAENENLPLSELVDEAISYYLEAIKSDKTK